MLCVRYKDIQPLVGIGVRKMVEKKLVMDVSVIGHDPAEITICNEIKRRLESNLGQKDIVATVYSVEPLDEKAYDLLANEKLERMAKELADVRTELVFYRNAFEKVSEIIEALSRNLARLSDRK